MPDREPRDSTDMRYLLTLRVPFEASDDPSARELAQRVLFQDNQALVHTIEERIGREVDVKLQKLRPGQRPEKVRFADG